MQLTFDQIRKYFELRFPGARIGTRNKASVKCFVHDDSNPSMTLFLDGIGGCHCNGCGYGGNIFQMEMKFSSCDLTQARANLAEITGAAPDKVSQDLGLCVAEYDYRDASGKTLFQKRRYQRGEEKDFRIYRPNPNGGWISGMGEAQKVLYNLPAVVTANVAAVCEGEKDCQTLESARLYSDRSDLRVAATCNFDGAGQPNQTPKWQAAYNPYFAGKVVLIFEDNDEAGRNHAQTVARGVAAYALAVYVVSFPEMPPKADVSDFLASHSVAELMERIKKTPRWQDTAEGGTARRVFVEFEEFCAKEVETIDWMLDRIIQRGANGFIAAPAKGSKSFVTADLLLALATGTSWLDFPVKRPVRCGLLSREDHYALTGWRLKSLLRGRGLQPWQLDGLKNLYVNTKAQTPSFSLDNEEEMAEAIADIKARRLEFVILDVFNVLHSADENDNTEMRKIMKQCVRLQDESGAALGIIHHFNKGMEGSSVTQKLRGAGAIGGYAEWIIGISMADEELRVRKMEFELKADAPPDPIFFRIDSDGESGAARLKRVEHEAKEVKPSRFKVV